MFKKYQAPDGAFLSAHFQQRFFNKGACTVDSRLVSETPVSGTTWAS
jgi:hypothetical protein